MLSLVATWELGRRCRLLCSLVGGVRTVGPGHGPRHLEPVLACCLMPGVCPTPGQPGGPGRGLGLGVQWQPLWAMGPPSAHLSLQPQVALGLDHQFIGCLSHGISATEHLQPPSLYMAEPKAPLGHKGRKQVPREIKEVIKRKHNLFSRKAWKAAKAALRRKPTLWGVRTADGRPETRHPNPHPREPGEEGATRASRKQEKINTNQNRSQ